MQTIECINREAKRGEARKESNVDVLTVIELKRQS